MTDAALERLLDDLGRVPLVPEPLIEGYRDGRWLYEPACARCGAPLNERWPGCLACVNRHEKRRQRGGRSPAPLRHPEYSKVRAA